MTLIYLSGAWVLGILLSGLSLSPVLALASLLPLSLLFFTRRRRLVLLASLCLALFLGGASRAQSSLSDLDSGSLAYFHGGTVTVTGVVAAEPEVRDKSLSLRLEAREVAIGGETKPVSGTALLTLPRYPAYHYGDVLQATGRLEAPTSWDGFDYADYLAHQGIYSTLSFPKVEVQERGTGFPPLDWVYSLRSQLAEALARVLPEPQASLAQGMVLGLRTNIPPGIRDDFNRSGTAHILAISGVNLSILAGILVSLGVWLFGRRHYIYVWLALSTIWFYALLTGAQPPVVRAAIMASLFLAAELFGRQKHGITALAFAAAIMVGIAPSVLYQASFQLSFLAMAGLMLVAPPLMTLGRRLTGRLGEEGWVVSAANLVTDSLAVTLGAILAVLPVISYYFGTVSLVGPLATLLALPVLPGIMLAGLLTGLAGLVFLPLAQAVGWLAWLFLSYTLLVVQGLADLPLASLPASFAPGHIWVYYPVLALALWGGKYRNKIISFASGSTLALSPRLQKWLILSLAVIASLVVAVAISLPDGDLHLSILDVGQGDAILIQMGGQDILVDGGPSPRALNLGLGEKMPFWNRTIELVVLTHPHADHVTGLIEVLSRYRVGQVLSPNLDYRSSPYDEWQKAVRERGIPGTAAQAGQQIGLGKGASVRVLNPAEPASGEGDDDGVVLEVTRGKVSFLLTADIGWEAEEELMSGRLVPSSTVLKVAHHGSAGSTSPEFLAVVSPRLAVISVGTDNRYGHPDEEVVARLKEIVSPEKLYRTDRQGTVEFITDGERLWVRTER